MEIASESHVSSVVEDNIQYLHQAAELLNELDGGAFIHTNAPMYGSGVGGHLRHCIDHYECFLNGIDEGRINYDHRQRDARLEVDVVYARDHLCSIIRRLAVLPASEVGKPVQSCMDCGSDCPEGFSASSGKRELQFLISHTLHHFALIAMILRDQGLEPHACFGVAPSTLRHRERQATCAQ